MAASSKSAQLVNQLLASAAVELNRLKEAELAIKLIFAYDSIGELSALDIEQQVLVMPAVIDYLDFSPVSGYANRKRAIDAAIAKEIKRYVIKH